MKIYVYALCEPETRVLRYIGRSKNPSRRLTDHIQEIKRYDNRKTRWLKQLLENYQIPEIIILEETNKTECAFWEEYYVDLFRSWNFDLFNTYNNFNKNYCHEESAKKASINNINKNKKIIHSEDTKRKIAENLKKRYLADPRLKELYQYNPKLITPIIGFNIDGRVIEFKSIGEASRILNLKSTKIQDYLKGRRYGKYKGWTFKYIDKNNS